MDRIKKELEELIGLIQKLRAPDGCPWDRKQKPEDIGKYILEETYEVIDALENKNAKNIKEELGDLLFQILFLAEMSAESNQFSLADIMAEVKEKMIRRHPHIFGDIKVNSVQEVKQNWLQIKNKERVNSKHEHDLFASVPRSLPALKRAQKITAIAANYGFDWPSYQGVLKKLNEELQEFEVAIKDGDHGKIKEEIGDIIFTLVNLSRFVQIDAEDALSQTTGKFLKRFSYINDKLATRGIPLEKATLAEMDKLWNEAKSRV